MATEKQWVIGRGSDCDVTVDNLSVSMRHCRLRAAKNGSIWLEDLGSSNGTFVNGVRTSGAVLVSRNDQISLGRSVPMPWPEELSIAGVKGVNEKDETDPSPCSGGRPRREVPLRRWLVGRAADCDIIVDDTGVSAHHCELIETPDGFVVEDLGSTNGTFVNGAQVDSNTEVRAGERILLGMNALLPWPEECISCDQSSVLTSRAPKGFRLPAKTWTDLSASFHGESIVFGRDPKCDQVLNHPMISRCHARLSRSGARLVLEDLGSANGTFLNGRRLRAIATVRPGDVIGLGVYAFRLSDQGALEKRDYRGNITLEAREVSVHVPGKRLLEGVSMTILPGELVGLMGLAGAGKTTLMTALNGYTRPSKGAVLLNGESLYANYAQFSTYLGYVPQDDIMHRDLTVHQALYYSARLRLPSDFSKSDIESRIIEVLKQLGLEGTEQVVVGSPERKGISGGQRRRVNLAMELLTDPQVLFLDEPTSGLSSEDALVVMKILRRLADSGKTILLTIHQPSMEVFRLMTHLAVVSKDAGSGGPAHLVYFGPAYPAAVEFFNPEGFPGAKPGIDPSPDEVLRGLAKRKTQEWIERFQASRYHREYVNERAGEDEPWISSPATREKRRVFNGSQWKTLVQRCLAVKAKDTWNTVILMAQAPIVAVLVVAVLGEGSVHTPVFLLGLAALWFGCSNAVREIVGEWAIYRRERMVNLQIASYVASKFAVLGGFCFIQCLVLLGIVYAGCKLQGPWLAMFLVLFLVALVGVGLGLALSAVARTSEIAIALLPIVLLPMVILGGIMQPLHNMKKSVRLLSYGMASRWAFEGILLLETESRGPAKVTAGDPPRQNYDMAEEFFRKNETRVGTVGCVTALTAMLLVLVLGIHGILRVRDIH